MTLVSTTTQTSQRQQYFSKCRPDLIEMESNNLKCRLQSVMSLVNTITNQFVHSWRSMNGVLLLLDVRSSNNNTNNILLPRPRPKNQNQNQNKNILFTTELDLAILTNRYLPYLQNWDGLKIQKVEREPKSYAEYRTKACNWLNGKRTPTYDQTLFPDIICSIQKFVNELPFGEWLNPVYNFRANTALKLKECLMYRILSQLCVAEFKLYSKKRCTHKTGTILSKDIKKRSTSRTIKLLKSFCIDYHNMTLFPATAFFSDDANNNYFNNDNVTLRQMAVTFQTHFVEHKREIVALISSTVNVNQQNINNSNINSNRNINVPAPSPSEIPSTDVQQKSVSQPQQQQLLLRDSLCKLHVSCCALEDILSVVLPAVYTGNVSDFFHPQINHQQNANLNVNVNAAVSAVSAVKKINGKIEALVERGNALSKVSNLNVANSPHMMAHPHPNIATSVSYHNNNNNYNNVVPRFIQLPNNIQFSGNNNNSSNINIHNLQQSFSSSTASTSIQTHAQANQNSNYLGAVPVPAPASNQLSFNQPPTTFLSSSSAASSMIMNVSPRPFSPMNVFDAGPRPKLIQSSSGAPPGSGSDMFCFPMYDDSNNDSSNNDQNETVTVINNENLSLNLNGNSGAENNSVFGNTTTAATYILDDIDSPFLQNDDSFSFTQSSFLGSGSSINHNSNYNVNNNW